MEQSPISKASASTNCTNQTPSIIQPQINDVSISLIDRLRAFDSLLPHLIIKTSNKNPTFFNLISEANELIHTFNRFVSFMYLDILTDQIQIDQNSGQEIYEAFEDVQLDVKFSETKDELFQSMIKGVKNLTSKYKKQFQSKSICKLIQRKIEQIEQILPNQQVLKFLISEIDFRCQRYDKGSSNSKWSKHQNITNFLTSNKIKIKEPLKPQIHKFLLKRSPVIVSYNGKKSIEGTNLHKDKYYHHFNIPYRVQVPFYRVLPYTKSIHLRGNKKYTGSKYMPRCCETIKKEYLQFSKLVQKATFGLFGLNPQDQKCHMCHEDLIEVPYSGVVDYDVRYEKQGTVVYDKTQTIEIQAKFTKTKEYHVSVPYRQEVAFKKDFQVNCEDHHRCSCKQLAEIVTSAKDVFEDIRYFTEILDLQVKVAEILNQTLQQDENSYQMVNKHDKIRKNPSEQTPTPGEKETHTPQHEQKETPTPYAQNHTAIQNNQLAHMPHPQMIHINQRSWQSDRNSFIMEKCKQLISKISPISCNILIQTLTTQKISQIIHKNLTKDHSFPVSVHGKTFAKIRQQLQHQVHFQGQQYYSGTLQHTGEVYYEDPYQYNFDLTYRGTVKTVSCHQDCWFCEVKQKDLEYEGTVHVCRKGRTEGFLPFRQRKNWEAHIAYSESVAFRKEIQRDIEVNYSDKCEAICQKSAKIGFGHHSCTSCEYWQEVLSSFLELVHIKQRLKSWIVKHKAIIKAALSQK